MTSTEAMVYQLKQLKGKPLKQKVEHILTYFWLPIVLFLALAIALGSYIYHLATVKDVALNVTCINAYDNSEATEVLLPEFAEKAKIDLDKYDVQISTNLVLDSSNLSEDYNTAQIVFAQIGVQAIDVLVADLNAATGYFYQDVYYDLNQLLTPQQKTQYSGNFLYVDMAVVRMLSDMEAESVQFPNPTKPEEMEEPVPVALLLDGNSDFAVKYYPHNHNSVAIGIVANSEKLENALAFLDYIMQ